MKIFRKFKDQSNTSGEGSLEPALIKLFTLMLGANVIKGALYVFDAYHRFGGTGAGRGIRLIITSIIILALVRKFRRYLKGFVHYAIIGTLLHIYYRVFNVAIGNDIVAIQAILMVLICGFYGLGKAWGLAYSAIACISVMLPSYLSFRFTGLQPLPLVLDQLYIAVNWAVIVLSHFYFHRVLFQQLKTSKAQNVQLDQLAQAKSTFLSTMSHELRTPLNSVIGLAELLKADPKDQLQQQRLEVLQFSANNLLSLVNDILDINKLDAGKLELEATSFDLNELLAGVVSGLQAQAEEKQLEFLIAGQKLVHQRFFGDPTRLSQILYNLVGNAIKFTAQGKVELKVTELRSNDHSSSIRFQVSDTGIGITAEQQLRIFQPFQQAMASTTRKYGGTGLGLAIVKQLLEMFGSQMEIQSTPGKGTVMAFEITLKKAEKTATEVKGQEPPADLGSLRVLLAEDNTVNIFFMKQLFKRWHITADYAENGRAAVDMHVKNDYDLILMDMYMPEMDGIEATLKIRELPDRKKKNIYIIALTASVSGDIQRRVRESGINDYLQKPFQLQALREKLEKALIYGKRI